MNCLLCLVARFVILRRALSATAAAPTRQCSRARRRDEIKRNVRIMQTAASVTEMCEMIVSSQRRFIHRAFSLLVASYRDMQKELSQPQLQAPDKTVVKAVAGCADDLCSWMMGGSHRK